MRKDNKSRASQRVALASFVGTTVEWYDFYLYGTAAALIFNKLFFPNVSPFLGIMASYTTYAVGFFARPLGGIIFGHFGDRISRKNMLIFTLVIMGLSTFCIGLLPTYNQIGMLAPILLLILRCIQGIGVGGEWGGAVVMTAETSREKERGFFASWPNAGAPFGLLLSILIFLYFSSLPQAQFLSWGWRVPFLIGILIVLVGLFIRLRMTESPIFQLAKHKPPKVPALDVMRTSPKNFILAMGSRFAESASFYIFTVFVLSYATTELQLPESLLLYAVMIGAVCETFIIPVFGKLSDKVGRRPIYMSGAMFIFLYAYPFFWLLQTKNTALVILAVVLGMIGHGAMHGPQAAFYSELFKTRIRYSGIAIAYHLSAAFSGGLAPLIATGLVAWMHGESGLVSVYLMLMALVTVTSVYFAVETRQKDISK